MPPPQSFPNNPRLQVTALLVMSLFVVGASGWETIWRRYRQQQPWLDRCEEPRTTWTHPTERLALLLALLWVALHLVTQILVGSRLKATTLTMSHLVETIVIGGGTVLLLIALIVGSGRVPAAAFGLKWRPLSSQLRDGWLGFRLMILPMVVSMAVVTPLRTRETQNPLLRLLADDPDYGILALIVFIAVVIAPVSEELLFRVILQSSLSQIVRPRLAILTVAILFSAVHGPVDGLALLPLALVLGCVFHRRHSYLAVVVIHGLFNATMLALAMLSAT